MISPKLKYFGHAETIHEHGYFKKHEVLRHEVMPNGAEFMTFGQPGTINCRLEYIYYAGRLFVSGDLGEAVYAWYSANSLEWVSGCGAGYFAGKCEASENGRGYKEWDSCWAEADMKEQLLTPGDHCEDYGNCEKCEEFDHELEEDYKDCDCYRSHKAAEKRWAAFEEAGGPGALSSETQFTMWVGDYDNREILGEEWWEWVPGPVRSMRCELHLAGLKFAFKMINQELHQVMKEMNE